MTLTSEFLDEVQARLDAATAGPWKSFVEGRDGLGFDSFVRTGGEDFYLTGGITADLDLIAHARQDLQLLMDEVRRLTKAAKA